MTCQIVPTLRPQSAPCEVQASIRSIEEPSVKRRSHNEDRSSSEGRSPAGVLASVATPCHKEFRIEENERWDGMA